MSCSPTASDFGRVRVDRPSRFQLTTSVVRTPARPVRSNASLSPRWAVRGRFPRSCISRAASRGRCDRPPGVWSPHFGISGESEAAFRGRNPPGGEIAPFRTLTAGRGRSTLLFRTKTERISGLFPMMFGQRSVSGVCLTRQRPMTISHSSSSSADSSRAPIVSSIRNTPVTQGIDRCPRHRSGETADCGDGHGTGSTIRTRVRYTPVGSPRITSISKRGARSP